MNPERRNAMRRGVKTTSEESGWSAARVEDGRCGGMGPDCGPRTLGDRCRGNQRLGITDRGGRSRGQQHALGASAVRLRRDERRLVRTAELRAKMPQRVHLHFLLHGEQQERQDGEDDGTAHGRGVYPTAGHMPFGHLD